MEATAGTVLIVDDTPENLQVIGEILEGEGHEVLVATSGAKAIEIASASPVELILLDILMPKMDGYEVCRRLKKNKYTRDIPIIFLTALGATENEATGLALGAVDYITKPFVVELAVARVNTHLALAKARKELKLKNEQLEDIVRERTSQLSKANQRLMVLGSAKYDFLNIIYQKLWEPKTGIFTITQMALDLLTADPPTFNRLQGQFTRSQLELVEIINNALLLGTAAKDTQQVRFESVIIERVVAGAIDKLKRLAQEKGLVFSFDETATTVVDGNLDLLFQAITTVLHVAILTADPPSPLTISFSESADLVHMSISMVGAKSLGGDLSQLFSPEMSNRVGGAYRDLGLAIQLSSKLVLAMGGQIVVESLSQKETALRLSLGKRSVRPGVTINLE